jgi:hypothetical protein
VEDTNMKVLQDKLREAQEKAQQALERTTTLPPAKCMTKFLAQRQSYLEVDKMRDQQKILQQFLKPMKEKVVRVIDELAIAQGKVKHESCEVEDKLTSLTVQGEKRLQKQR